MFAYRHFPLPTIHPHARPAAEAAESAGVHGEFWLMHDLLFRDQQHLDVPALVARAAALGLDAPHLLTGRARSERIGPSG